MTRYAAPSSSSATAAAASYEPTSRFRYLANVHGNGRYVVAAAEFDEQEGLWGAKKVLNEEGKPHSGFIWVPSHDEVFELIQKIVQIEPMVPPTHAALDSQHDKGKVGVFMSILMNAIIGFAKASPNETHEIMEQVIQGEINENATVDIENMTDMPKVMGVVDEEIQPINHVQGQYLTSEVYPWLFDTSVPYEEPVRDVYYEMEKTEDLRKRVELLEKTKKDGYLERLAYALLRQMAATSEFKGIVRKAQSSSCAPQYEDTTRVRFLANVTDQGRYVVSAVEFDEQSGLWGAKKVLDEEGKPHSGFIWVPGHDEVFELVRKIVQIEPMVPPTYSALNKQHDKGKVGVLMSIFLNAAIGFAKASPNETHEIMEEIIDGEIKQNATVDIENLTEMPKMLGVTDDEIREANDVQEQYFSDPYDTLFETKAPYQPPERDVYSKMQRTADLTARVELLEATKYNGELERMAYALLRKVSETPEFKQIVDYVRFDGGDSAQAKL